MDNDCSSLGAGAHSRPLRYDSHFQTRTLYFGVVSLIEHMAPSMPRARQDRVGVLGQEHSLAR